MKKIIKWLIPWINESKKIYKLYQKSHKLYQKGRKYFCRYYTFLIKRRHHCIISPCAVIGKKLNLPHPMGIVIGDGTIIKDNVTIYQNVTLGRKYKDVEEYPVIGNNVTIYSNSVIVGNVTIGDDAVIGCNSVVLRDVKNGEVVTGVVK